MTYLAVNGLIRTVAIDKAHDVEQSGRSFRRTEFVEAAKSMNSSLMDGFVRFGELDGIGIARFNDDGTVTLSKISIMTATSAANCGVSSNALTLAMHEGFPFSLYDMVQELGCVN